MACVAVGRLTKRRARQVNAWAQSGEIGAALRKADLSAQKRVEKELDIEGKELDRQLADAEKDLAKS